MKKRKTLIIILIVLVLLVGGVLGMRSLSMRQLNSLVNELETRIVERGTLLSQIDTDGHVRSEQQALLSWEASGEVLELNVAVGDVVISGEILAILDPESLSEQVILAQANLVEAQKALNDLLNSQVQSAQAKKNVEAVEQALEDAFASGLTQAQALVVIAEAERLLESAERRYGILMTPPSEMSVQQVNSNILLTKDVIEDLEERVADLEKTLSRASFSPYESYSLYKTLYRNSQMELARQQERLWGLENRYAELLAPPEPLDVMVSEAEVSAAQANLADALRQWERVKDGPSEAEIAVLEAQLENAQREWERLKDGPTQDDITVAEAQLTAAQVTLDSVFIEAPFDGVITLVENKPGDLVSPGAMAFRMDDLSHLLVDLQVSEIDINNIVLGQNVTLTFDAILASEYLGQIVKISPVGTVLDGVVTFEVTVELVDADEYVRPGMTTAVKIEIGRVEDVLLIPSEAIRFLDGQRVVYLFGDSTLFKPAGNPPEGGPSDTPDGGPGLFGGSSPLDAIYPVPITVGISSGNYSEVIGGDLEVGDVVVLDPPTELLNTPMGSISP